MARRLGAILLVAGLFLVSSPWWVPVAAAWEGRALIASSPLVETSHTSATTQALPAQRAAVVPWTPAVAVAEPPSGSVIGTLAIPRLGISTAVMQGTSSRELYLAPGHYLGSVLPGEVGTSVVAAHNATFFRHLDTLRPGDLIQVQTVQGTFWFQVTNGLVVSDTEPLVDTAYPSLDLEACYPLDALYFTPTRYVVEARLVADVLAKRPRVTERPAALTYQATIPALVQRRYPLSLKENALPMGTLTYTGRNTPETTAFKQSGQSLALEEQAIRLFEAARYTSPQREGGWFASLFKAGSAPTPAQNVYWGAAQVRFEGPLDVRIHLTSKGVPTSAILYDAAVAIDGTRSAVTMTVAVESRRLTIQSLQWAVMP